MIEQVGNLVGGLKSAGTKTGSTAPNKPPNDTIYLCNFRKTTF